MNPPTNGFDRAIGIAAIRRLRRRRGAIPFVRQWSSGDCGLAALAMVLAYHGRPVPLADLRASVGSTRDGASATALIAIARRYRLVGQWVTVEMEELKSLPPATILFWAFNHYVVFARVTRSSVSILDPAVGSREVPLTDATKLFTGAALILEPEVEFDPTPPPASSSGLWRYLRKGVPEPRAAVKIVVTSLVLRMVALALPLLTAFVVERLLPSAELQLVSVLVGGVLTLGATYFVGSMVRSHLSLGIIGRVQFVNSVIFVDHLVNLPFAFFEQHTVADLSQRLNSGRRVHESLASIGAGGLLDALLCIVYLLLLSVSSWKLAAVTGILALLRVLVLVALHKRQYFLACQSIEMQARCSSYQIEMISGMELLKSSGSENQAARRWAELYVDELNVILTQERLLALFAALKDSLSFISPLIILCCGSALVMTGQLTLSTMLGLTALAYACLLPLDQLVESLKNISQMTSSIERIEEVMALPAEQAPGLHVPERVRGEMSVRGVYFQYGPLSRPVLSDVTFEVPAGRSLAIVGMSGSGKSTLGRLLVGLYQPTGGEVRLDGYPLATLNYNSLRQQFGVVTQSAFCFSGSIRSNIALGHPYLGLDEVIAAAKAACVHDEIAAMPMGYDTLVGTGGSSISGGQRQRIALARALAHTPSLLLLDEATSNLDAVTESRIHANLSLLKCTRIVVAHRLSTVRHADEILVLHAGSVAERGTHESLMSRQGAYAALVAAQLPDPAP
jgi:ABC-type bacteriocin/lantibiotic exporter with double-glycine peptidase domain